MTTGTDAIKAPVLNRGSIPSSVLIEFVGWGRSAPDDIFAPRPAPAPPAKDPDVYAYLKPILGPWTSLQHRRAAMLELARVHGGFESSWNWNEDYDKNNPSSKPGSIRAETGMFQVSFDSTELRHGAMVPFADAHGIGFVGPFIVQMKANHKLALEYYARLMRIDWTWAGPLDRHLIDKWLSREAVVEWMQLLG